MPNIHGLMQNHTLMGLSVSELFFCLSRETQVHKLFYMRQALALLPSPGEVNSSTGLYSSACPLCLLEGCLALAMNEITPPLHVGHTPWRGTCQEEGKNAPLQLISTLGLIITKQGLPVGPELSQAGISASLGVGPRPPPNCVCRAFYHHIIRTS